MAKRISKSAINWAEFEKRVPPQEKGKFFAFKARADAYLRRVHANPPEAPKIDWAYYKKIVPVPGLVDKFQSEYQAFKVPFPADTVSSQIDEQWTKLQGEVKAFCAEMQKDIEEAQKELDKIKALPRFEDMTIEVFYDMYPDLTLDSVNKPTFWPHNKEEQMGYKES